jgi:ribosomal 50S subunit-recycling heat shock protein
VRELPAGGIMRIDKFLKVSRLIKRRTVANDACGSERVTLNGKSTKPGDRVKVGDVIELAFGDKTLKVQVESIAEHVSKDSADSLYKIISESKK